MKQLIIEGQIFYSQKDEENMFRWLEYISDITEIKGCRDQIILSVKDEVSDAGLREIISLFFRYGIEMAQLSIFLSNSNEMWFSDSKMFWYDRVFYEPARL